jgi:hypothetical protein
VSGITAHLADEFWPVAPAWCDVDELHLFTYPITLGGGLRLLPEGHEQTKLSLVAAHAFGNGVVHLVYGPPD